ncbi:MAG: hypothetical protein H7Y04_15125 [Verrucomicrobia bacterium]|nr:hypothetical protein [Cytophagales bacterium]
MTFANKLINTLFPAATERNKPFLIEKLERNQHQKINYNRWLQTSEPRTFNETIYLAYKLKKHRKQKVSEILIFHSQYSQTLLIPYHHSLENYKFQYYFDYVKDSILSIGYHTTLAEREINDRETHIETTERYYLGFSDEFRVGGRIHQLYGSLLLELQLLTLKCLRLTGFVVKQLRE